MKIMSHRSAHEDTEFRVSTLSQHSDNRVYISTLGVKCQSPLKKTAIITLRFPKREEKLT